jgi:CheY-like chemotaxis protein
MTQPDFFLPVTKQHEPDKSCRVLVIDDDPALTEHLSELFLLEGCEVLLAQDGLQAIQRLIEDGLPDIVFLDMHMDGFDGWDFQAELKRLGLAIPTVVMTGDSQPDRCAEEVGAVAYLAKPFDLHDLRNLLDDMIVVGKGQGRGPGRSAA